MNWIGKESLSLSVTVGWAREIRDRAHDGEQEKKSSIPVYDMIPNPMFSALSGFEILHTGCKQNN